VPPPTASNACFHIIHINIRSLQKNHDDLIKFLSLCRLPPNIICLSKTRIKEKPSINISIPGYQFIHENSPTNAEGVAMYISNSINFQKLTHFYNELAGSENIWINIELSKNEKYVIGTIYRHTNLNPRSV